MVLSSILDWPCGNDAVGGDALARADGNHVAGLQVFDVYFHLDTVAQQPRVVRHRLDKSLDGGFGPSGCVAFKPFADQHDEHRFGGGKVFAYASSRR